VQDMAAVRRLTTILAADVAGNSRLMNSRPNETDELPVSTIPAAYLIAPSLIVLFAIAGATWWAWRLVSLEFTAIYAEGFRKVGMPEE
jgi:hypothetical protein